MRILAFALALSTAACTANGGDEPSSPDDAADAAPSAEDSGSAPGAPSDSGVGSTDSSPATDSGSSPDDTGTEVDAGDPPPPARGADVPWDEYEAESTSFDGTVLGPSRAFGDLAAEASGRRAVRLGNGQSMHFAAKRKGNSIVVRYSIPDGVDASIAVSVDGKKVADLPLTSRYAWIYGGETNSSSNDPGAGGAHHFYDEVRALLPEFSAGAVIELKKSDGVATTVDLVDLEEVGPALPMPAGALSITSFGAIKDDGKDDGKAISDCIAAARAAKKVCWIPEGTFESTASEIAVSDVTLAGAGMWRSTVHGFFARFHCTGNNCVYKDFSVFGETVTRDDSSPESAFLGGAGTGSRLENIWVEHQKTGYWVGNSPTDGLVITGCRFRDLFADGVNLCNGASNSVVENSHARNTGDDAFASWSPSFDGGVNQNNVFRHLSVQLPWRANCFAIYGGKDNRIEDSTCADTVMYPGVLLAQQFNSHAFDGTTTVARVTLTRAGGPMYGQHHGALKLQAFDSDMKGFHLQDVDIVDPTYSGLHFQGGHGIDGVVIDNMHIEGGIHVDADAHGHATANGVVVSSGGLSNDSASFILDRGPGNSGW